MALANGIVIAFTAVLIALFGILSSPSALLIKKTFIWHFLFLLLILCNLFQWVKGGVGY